MKNFYEVIIDSFKPYERLTYGQLMNRCQVKYDTRQKFADAVLSLVLNGRVDRAIGKSNGVFYYKLNN